MEQNCTLELYTCLKILCISIVLWIVVVLLGDVFVAKKWGVVQFCGVVVLSLGNAEWYSYILQL